MIALAVFLIVVGCMLGFAWKSIGAVFVAIGVSLAFRLALNRL